MHDIYMIYDLHDLHYLHDLHDLHDLDNIPSDVWKTLKMPNNAQGRVWAQVVGGPW